MRANTLFVVTLGAILLITTYHFIRESSLGSHNNFIGTQDESQDEKEVTDSYEVKLAKQWLVPPSTLPLNLSEEMPSETSMGQLQLIRELFHSKRGGFFVECGALDGVTRSNTLTLERDLGWEGLLIEGDYKSVEQIKNIHRKAWLMPTCLSLLPYAMNVTFVPAGHVGKIGGRTFSNNSNTDLTCLPLSAMLKALNRNSVDYFSLDVEGNELEVLETIPFDEIEIKALSVEKTHLGEKNRKGSPEELLLFMTKKGYKMRATVKNKNNLANDFIFVKSGFNEDVKLFNIST